RLTPRENQDVNQYWMCDYGRLNTFKYVNDKSTRVNSPMVKPIQDNALADVGWDDAIARVISEVKNYKPEEIGFIASPFTTLEDNYALRRFAEEVVGSPDICYIPKIIKGNEDDFLLRADKSPNSKGVEFLGIKPVSKDFVQKILQKQL